MYEQVKNSKRLDKDFRKYSEFKAVYVPKGYKNKKLYEPVWVTGVITAKSMVKDLYLVDGSAAVDIGYSMQAKNVKPYKK